jgi:hypothetical protein
MSDAQPLDNDDDLETEIMHKLCERYLAVHEELSQEVTGDLENWRPTGLLRYLDQVD